MSFCNCNQGRLPCTCGKAASNVADPVCDKCGAPMTTAFMAVFCPQREQCAFFPAEPDLQEFIRSMYPTEPPSAQGEAVSVAVRDELTKELF